MKSLEEVDIEPLRLELQEAVSHLTWVLGTRLDPLQKQVLSSVKPVPPAPTTGPEVRSLHPHSHFNVLLYRCVCMFVRVCTKVCVFLCGGAGVHVPRHIRGGQTCCCQLSPCTLSETGCRLVFLLHTPGCLPAGFWEIPLCQSSSSQELWNYRCS